MSVGDLVVYYDSKMIPAATKRKDEAAKRYKKTIRHIIFLELILFIVPLLFIRIIIYIKAYKGLNIYDIIFIGIISLIIIGTYDRIKFAKSAYKYYTSDVIVSSKKFSFPMFVTFFPKFDPIVSYTWDEVSEVRWNENKSNITIVLKTNNSNKSLEEVPLSKELIDDPKLFKDALMKVGKLTGGAK